MSNPAGDGSLDEDVRFSAEIIVVDEDVIKDAYTKDADIKDADDAATTAGDGTAATTAGDGTAATTTNRTFEQIFHNCV